MIRRVLDLYQGLAKRAILVVQPAVINEVDKHVWHSPLPVTLIDQDVPTGMLDAVLQCLPFVQAHRPRRIWITWCDQIALRPDTIEKLRGLDDGPAPPDLALVTCRMKHPYVHIERDQSGRITRVLHRREGDAMPDDGESDAGLFDLSYEAFMGHFIEYAGAPQIGKTTRERNFVPFVAWMAARGTVATVACAEPEEAIGVNTPEELARIDAYLRARESR